MAHSYALVRLGSVANVRSGFAFKSDDMGDTGRPLIKIKNVVPPSVDVADCDRIPDNVIATIPDVERYAITPGDILIAMTGATVGKVGCFPVTRERFYLNQRVGKVYLTSPGKADYRFLYYVLSQDTYVNQMFGTADGSAQANISGAQIERLEIPMPPLPEQRAIAHILGTLDDKIESNRRMNETLDAMARALFKSWFVDFDPVRAKAEGRDTELPKHIAGLFPDSFEDSELGEIPRGWTVKSVGDVAIVVGGTTPSTKNSAYWDGGKHAWATPKDLSALAVPVLLDTERRITDTGLAQIGSGLLPKGTVLLSSRAPIGYLAVAEIPIAINQGFIAMTPKAGTSNLFLLLWASAAHEDIVSRANGSTFLEISKTNFRPIPIIAPSANVMRKFDQLVRPVYERIVECARESRQLAATRDVLLPKLISGELRLANKKHWLPSLSNG